MWVCAESKKPWIFWIILAAGSCGQAVERRIPSFLVDTSSHVRSAPDGTLWAPKDSTQTSRAWPLFSASSLHIEHIRRSLFSFQWKKCSKGQRELLSYSHNRRSRDRRGILVTGIHVPDIKTDLNESLSSDRWSLQMLTESGIGFYVCETKSDWEHWVHWWVQKEMSCGNPHSEIRVKESKRICCPKIAWALMILQQLWWFSIAFCCHVWGCAFVKCHSRSSSKNSHRPKELGWEEGRLAQTRWFWLNTDWVGTTLTLPAWLRPKALPAHGISTVARTNFGSVGINFRNGKQWAVQQLMLLGETASYHVNIWVGQDFIPVAICRHAKEQPIPCRST